MGLATFLFVVYGKTTSGRAGDVILFCVEFEDGSARSARTAKFSQVIPAATTTYKLQYTIFGRPRGTWARTGSGIDSGLGYIVELQMRWN